MYMHTRFTTPLVLTDDTLIYLKKTKSATSLTTILSYYSLMDFHPYIYQSTIFKEKGSYCITHFKVKLDIQKYKKVLSDPIFKHKRESFSISTIFSTGK